MKTVTLHFLSLAMTLSVAIPVAFASEGFKSFHEEANRVTEAIACRRPDITPGGYGLGSLFGCIMGDAQTAKFWINEGADQSGRVTDVKVMWNDWFRDVGYGVHADKRNATKMVQALAALYAPPLRDELLKAFAGTDARTFEHGSFRIEYMYARGPAIDERLFTVTER